MQTEPASRETNTPNRPAQRRLNAIWLGRRPYEPVYDLQIELFQLRQQQQIDDVVLLLEHEPTITHGRGAKPQHLLATESELTRRGVASIQTNRGGDVTLHAPGQLVAYPIIDLAPDRRDVRRYVRSLSQVMGELAAGYGLGTGEIPAMIGLWSDRVAPDRFPGHQSLQQPVKLGAIGVRISRWITMHGFALNLTTDLSLFRLIVPCGIQEHGVSSIAELTGKQPAVSQVARVAHRELAKRLDRKLGDYTIAPNAPLQAEQLLSNQSKARMPINPTRP